MNGIPPYVWLIGAAIYLVCPLDGDFIPVVGWLDDLLVVVLGIHQWRQGLKREEECARLEGPPTEETAPH